MDEKKGYRKMKTFDPEELKMLEQKMLAKEPFCFTRYVDGEYGILVNEKIGNLEWQFRPEEDKWLFDELTAACAFNSENYFVGIPCSCHHPKTKIDAIRAIITVPESQILTGNMFINHNHLLWMPIAQRLDSMFDHIVFVGAGNTERLPFTVSKFFQTNKEAHRTNLSYLQEIPDYVSQLDGALVMIGCGPFAKILAKAIWEKTRSNTILDIGSSFDELQGLGQTRSWYRVRRPQCYKEIP